MNKVTKKALILYSSLVLFIIFLLGGYLYFFVKPASGDHYLQIASKMDSDNPYGSVESIKYYNKAINLYKKDKNKKAVVETYIKLGFVHYRLANILQVKRSVKRAIDIGQEDISDESKAKIYLLLAISAEPAEARKYIKESLLVSERFHFKPLVAEAYFVLGVTYEYQANFEDAKKNYLKAIEVVSDFPTTDIFLNAPKLYGNLAELYAGEGNLDKAIIYYSEILNYSLSEERGFVTANYMKIIGDLYKENGNLKSACRMWKQSKSEYELFGAIAPFSIKNEYNSNKCTLESLARS